MQSHEVADKTEENDHEYPERPVDNTRGSSSDSSPARDESFQWDCVSDIVVF